jgi:hypothetical protein
MPTVRTPGSMKMMCSGETCRSSSPQISRFSLDGQLLWRAWAGDIFTGPASIEGSVMTVSTFEGRTYRIQLDTGEISN